MPGAYFELNKCLLCPNGCSKCSNAYLCSECNLGYFLASEACYPCDLSVCETC